MSVDYGLPFVDVMHHRLLAVDVLSGLQCVNRNVIVPVIGNADQHGVDIFAGQNFAVIAGGKNVIAPHLFGPHQSGVVQIGHGYDFGARHFKGAVQIEMADDARPNQADIDRVGGRAWLNAFDQAFAVGAGIGLSRNEE